MHLEIALAHFAAQTVELIVLVAWLGRFSSILHEDLVALKLTHACLQQYRPSV